ncbi:MAG: hypothetical protein K5755_07060 [Clostridiales bacterium]|nr:hypothetical protein [Clostridiales bacterium]
MKYLRIITAVLLSLVIAFSLCSCSIEMIDKSPATTTEPIPTDDHDGWDGVPEYEVKKYEIEDRTAFEVQGDLNVYKYDTIDDAEKVIDVLNDYYKVDLKVDEDTHYEDGYGNWFWDNGETADVISAAVSLSSKTGKFSFYYAPGQNAVLSASKVGSIDEDKWDEKVTEFVSKFEFVTGKLEMDGSIVYNDLYYPCITEDGGDSDDVQVKGRRYFFVSDEYSKQRVDAQDGLSCYVECGNSEITARDVQYFVVTIFNDGTIVSVDNNITKAPIIPDGTQKMIDENDMEKLVSFFTSTVEDDTFILKRAYVCSYDNYFGRPGISPVIKIEYAFKSNPSDVQATEIALEGFYD